jgi:aminoglycoside 2'-N-acetyltransferase I
MFDISVIPSSRLSRDVAAEIIRLCSAVFDLDYSYYMNLCPDRVHVLGYVSGALVSHALWLDRKLRVGQGPWLDAAYVEGMATHAEHRQRGYGATVMRRLQDEVRGYDLAALSPAVPEWYKKLGWEEWQGPLWIDHDGQLEPTPEEECVLICRTPRTPPLDLTAPLTGEWRPFELW